MTILSFHPVDRTKSMLTAFPRRGARLKECSVYDTKLHPVVKVQFSSSWNSEDSAQLPLISHSVWSGMVVLINIKLTRLKIISIREKYLKLYYCIQIICFKNGYFYNRLQIIIIIIIIITIIYSLTVFQISFSRWFLTGVWVTVSLLKSSGLFSVFLPFLIMM